MKNVNINLFLYFSRFSLKFFKKYSSLWCCHEYYSKRFGNNKNQENHWVAVCRHVCVLRWEQSADGDRTFSSGQQNQRHPHLPEEVSSTILKVGGGCFGSAGAFRVLRPWMFVVVSFCGWFLYSSSGWCWPEASRALLSNLSRHQVPSTRSSRWKVFGGKCVPWPSLLVQQGLMSGVTQRSLLETAVIMVVWRSR